MTTAIKNSKSRKPAKASATESVSAESVKAETVEALDVETVQPKPKQTAPALSLSEAVAKRASLTGSAARLAKGDPTLALALVAPAGSLERAAANPIRAGLAEAEAARKLACKPSYTGTDALTDSATLKTVNGLRAAWRRAKIATLNAADPGDAVEIGRLKARKLNDDGAWRDPETLNRELHTMKAKGKRQPVTVDDVLAACVHVPKA